MAVEASARWAQPAVSVAHIFSERTELGLQLERNGVPKRALHCSAAPLPVRADAILRHRVRLHRLQLIPLPDPTTEAWLGMVERVARTQALSKIVGLCPNSHRLAEPRPRVPLLIRHGERAVLHLRLETRACVAAVRKSAGVDTGRCTCRSCSGASHSIARGARWPQAKSPRASHVLWFIHMWYTSRPRGNAEALSYETRIARYVTRTCTLPHLRCIGPPHKQVGSRFSAHTTASSPRTLGPSVAH